MDEFLADYEPTQQQTHSKPDIILERITNKVHIVTFPQGNEVNLVQYALTHYNCVLRPKCKWRCTHYTKDFTVNMFRRNSWVLTTKIDDVQSLYQKIHNVYGKLPTNIQVVNKTMIFKINAVYSLDELYDYLTQTSHSTEGINLLDKQRYPAIICVISNTQTITLEIYHKGAINATGMKSDLDVQMVRDFIHNRLLTFLTLT